MDKDYFYFKLIFIGKSQKEVSFALRHEETYEKWIQNINKAI